jgi:hypothetical protein|tara:strand:- start:3245 stop:4483 length:1239 start_codon:yes stop_codon:yes gene_type:complete
MYGNKFKEATKSLMSHCREHMGYDNDPDVRYVTDNGNANNMLGYTAHYQPDKKVVTVYISNRHPKDVLRSLSHELVHHAQNCRGDLENTQTEEGYAQKDPHMRKMEEEAYLKGNMMFRDWEDSCKQQNMILPSTIGENKMSEQLNNLIAEKVKAKLEEQGVQVDEGFLDRFKSRASGFASGAKQVGKNVGALGRAAKAGLSGDSDAAKGALDGVSSVGNAGAAGKLTSRARSAFKQIGKLSNDIFNDMKALGLEDSPELKRVLGQISGAQKAVAALADEKLIAKFLAKRSRDLEESEGIEEGACPECGMSPCACPVHEDTEEVEEAKKPDADGDGVPDWADKKSDKDDKDDEEEKSDKDMSKVPPQFRKHVAKKKVDENELTDIKSKQSSINGLNENRLLNINKELMRRLLK